MATSRRERRIRNRKERKAQVEAQRAKFKRRQRNKRIINYAVLALIAIGIIYAVSAYLHAKNAPSQYDALAKCLTNSGTIMYGTDWCPHCQEQKRRFGNSFRLVTYINCDLNSQACDLAGVTGYPTWKFPDGTNATGEQDLSVLAQRAGCSDAA